MIGKNVEVICFSKVEVHSSERVGSMENGRREGGQGAREEENSMVNEIKE